MAEVAGHRGVIDGTSADLAQAILDSTLTHLLGQSRSHLLLLQGYLAELEAVRDPRAHRVIEALGLTLADPPRPGTLRHVERAAGELLRALSAG